MPGYLSGGYGFFFLTFQKPFYVLRSCPVAKYAYSSAVKRTWYEERTPTVFSLPFQLATLSGFQINRKIPKGSLYILVCATFIRVASVLTLLSQLQDIFGSNRLHAGKVTRCLESKKVVGVGGVDESDIPQPHGLRPAAYHHQLPEYDKWGATTLPASVRCWALQSGVSLP